MPSHHGRKCTDCKCNTTYIQDHGRVRASVTSNRLQIYVCNINLMQGQRSTLFICRLITCTLHFGPSNPSLTDSSTVRGALEPQVAAQSAATPGAAPSLCCCCCCYVHLHCRLSDPSDPSPDLIFNDQGRNGTASCGPVCCYSWSGPECVLLSLHFIFTPGFPTLSNPSPYFILNYQGRVGTAT